MSVRIWALLVSILFLTVALAACGRQAKPSEEGGAPAGTEMQADAGEVGGQPADQSGAPAEGQAPVPQIASGTMPPLATDEPPAERPEAASDRRVVAMKEAVEKAPFTVLEPQELPDEAHRDIVFLEEPLEGDSAPGLPAVRIVYSLQPSGMLTLIQSPATGEPAEGEEVDIEGNPGWLTEGTALVLVWEAGGVRYSLRGSGTDRNAVLRAARSMGPAKDLDALP